MAGQNNKKSKVIIAGREIPEMDPEIPRKLRKIAEGAFKLRVDQDLVEKYTLFCRFTSSRCDTVYHPCSGLDISPSKAFPDSKVLYVEKDRKVAEALKEAGLDAYYTSALEFDPGEVDILIMLNPEIPPDKPAQYVVSGGYVLCNNYHKHKTAVRMKENSDFQFIGIIWEEKERGLIFDVEQLEDCWLGKKGGADDLFVFQKV